MDGPALRDPEEREAFMRKWLIILALLAAAVFALASWLAGKADANKPEPGRVTLEVQDGL